MRVNSNLGLNGVKLKQGVNIEFSLSSKGKKGRKNKALFEIMLKSVPNPTKTYVLDHTDLEDSHHSSYFVPDTV